MFVRERMWRTGNDHCMWVYEWVGLFLKSTVLSASMPLIFNVKVFRKNVHNTVGTQLCF